MKKSFSAAFIAAGLFTALLSVSCKDKENVSSKIMIPSESVEVLSEKVESSSTQEVVESKSAKGRKVNPIRFNEIDPSLSKFYLDGKLCDTMYVDSLDGLKAREGCDLRDPVYATLPYRYAAKLISIEEKDVVDGIESYWVRISIPNYNDDKNSPSYGHVFGGYLSQDVPDFIPPQTAKELAAYICQLPIQLYNYWWPDSYFGNCEHYVCFYPDNTFDYFKCGVDEDMDKYSGKWEALSSSHIKLYSNELKINDLYIHGVSEEEFSCPETDSPSDKYICRGIRFNEIPFTNEKMLKFYRYSYIMKMGEDGCLKKQSFFNRKIDSYKSILSIDKIIASGVDVSGTECEEDYKNYWNPIRKDFEIFPLELPSDCNAPYLSSYMSNASDAVGSYITPNKSKSNIMYRIPCKDEKFKVGTFDYGDVAVIEAVEEFSYPIPVVDVFYKILNTANGVEGWIYINTESEEDYYKASILGAGIVDETSFYNRVNGNVTVQEYEIQLPKIKPSSWTMSHDGSIFAYFHNGSIMLNRVGEEEPYAAFAFEDGVVDKCTPLAFSKDDKTIYTVDKSGVLYKYNVGGIVEEIAVVHLDDGRFKEPSRIFVSPDSNETVFLIGTRDTGSRVSPCLVVYRANADEKFFTFDIRSKKDEQKGYYNYSDVQFNDRNEALYSMRFGDGVLVKIAFDKNNKPVPTTIDLDSTIACCTPMFSPDGKGFVLSVEGDNPFLVKMAENGKIIEKKSALIVNSHYTTQNSVLVSPDGKYFAFIGRNYEGFYAPVMPSISVYSASTMNLIYTSYFQLDNLHNMVWENDRFIFQKYDSAKGYAIKMVIDEKKEQICLTSEPGSVVKLDDIRSCTFGYDDQVFLNIYFDSNGFYKIISSGNYEAGEEVARISGPFEWGEGNEITLYSATWAWAGMESKPDEMGKMMMNIPIIEAGNMMKGYYYPPSGGDYSGKFSNQYYGVK